MPKRDTVLAALGQNVRQRRETRGLTQEKLAEKSGLDPAYISGIERGLRNPGIRNVARLAKALGFRTSELCEGVDVRTTQTTGIPQRMRKSVINPKASPKDVN